MAHSDKRPWPEEFRHARRSPDGTIRTNNEFRKESGERAKSLEEAFSCRLRARAGLRTPRLPLPDGAASAKAGTRERYPTRTDMRSNKNGRVVRSSWQSLQFLAIVLGKFFDVFVLTQLKRSNISNDRPAVAWFDLSRIVVHGARPICNHVIEMADWSIAQPIEVKRWRTAAKTAPYGHSPTCSDVVVTGRAKNVVAVAPSL